MSKTIAKGAGAAPVAAETERRAQLSVWVNEGGSPDRESGMLRVLVIEDEVIIGMLLGQVLEGMGHEVSGVERTEQGAVAAAARVRPDLIVVDEHLRAGSGRAAIERILLDGFIPHIWMSRGLRRHPNLAQGVAVLQKPFTEHALGLAIAHVFKPSSSVKV